MRALSLGHLETCLDVRGRETLQPNILQFNSGFALDCLLSVRRRRVDGRCGIVTGCFPGLLRRPFDGLMSLTQLFGGTLAPVGAPDAVDVPAVVLQLGLSVA